MISVDVMFSLLYGLWEYVFRKEELRILILGLDKAGKTTVLEKLKVDDASLYGSRPPCIVVSALDIWRATKRPPC